METQVDLESIEKCRKILSELKKHKESSLCQNCHMIHEGLKIDEARKTGKVSQLKDFCRPEKRKQMIGCAHDSTQVNNLILGYALLSELGSSEEIEIAKERIRRLPEIQQDIRNIDSNMSGDRVDLDYVRHPDVAEIDGVDLKFRRSMEELEEVVKHNEEAHDAIISELSGYRDELIIYLEKYAS